MVRSNRIAVDVLEINRAWRDDLHVALDTNVIQALVKTGGITLLDDQRGRSANQIVNMNPDSEPTKRDGYAGVQDAFEAAAASIGENRIVFDELWTEHRAFISNPLLQDQSILADELVDWARFRSNGPG